MERIRAILGNVLRSFDLVGAGRERGGFKGKPPRSMTYAEKQYYDIKKNLNNFYN